MVVFLASLPISLIIGWLVYVIWTLGLAGWWSAVLCKIDDTSYLPPADFYKLHNGTVYGDLLILGPNESLTVGSIGVSLIWIEVSSIRPHQHVMRVLAGDESVMISGCIDGGEESKFPPGATIIPSSNNYIYSWIKNSF